MVNGNKTFSLEEVVRICGPNSSIMKLGNMISSKDNLKFYSGEEILSVVRQTLEDDVWVKNILCRRQVEAFLEREYNMKDNIEYAIIIRDGYELIACTRGEAF